MRSILHLMLLMILGACAAPPDAVKDVWSEEERAKALALGDTISQATFSSLTDRLRKAIAEGGPANAVDQCWNEARPITDEISSQFGVKVKRTSTRLRSPANRPDAHEQERLNEALSHLATGNGPSTLTQQVFLWGDSIAYYKPILITSPLCLKCHGVPGMELDSAAHAVITERYPEDAAVGYAMGDLRGYWSIRWPRTPSFR